METELWPNLIIAANARAIPLALVNARLSARSQRGYQRFPKLIRPALAALRVIAAQTAADAERLIAIGARNVSTIGNIKFDVTPSPEKRELGAQWRESLGSRPVWLAASTREGEEALILDAFARIRRPDLLLLLVPRHPQRFAEVAAMIQERGLALCRRSEGNLPGDETRVWLGDSMGEMPAYYSVADIALIGGTLLPFGGQNLIEAAACGCPVLVGPHTFNFAQATEDSIACGAARRITDATEAARSVEALLEKGGSLQSMRDAALDFSQAHRGATARTVALIRRAMARQETPR
jgi:3-deoxy-D-manno-octulosonic-acid transferase